MTTTTPQAPGGLRSMTGFGRATATVDAWSVVVEVKTVNHKGLDVKLRLPRALAAQEQSLTHQIKSRLDRGRVDVAIDLAADHADAAVALDVARVTAVVAALRGLAREMPEIKPELTAGDILRIPGVLEHQEAPKNLEALQQATAQALSSALDELEATRLREGQGLWKDLDQRRRTCTALVDDIATQTTNSSAEKKAKLQERLTVLLGETVDPARLATEAAVLAERLDVSEEMARLRLHLEALEALLSKAGAGRKLDFLCQELLREANTTASKCQDAGVVQRVVDLKSEIERLREQAQNIE